MEKWYCIGYGLYFIVDYFPLICFYPCEEVTRWDFLGDRTLIVMICQSYTPGNLTSIVVKVPANKY